MRHVFSVITHFLTEEFFGGLVLRRRRQSHRYKLSGQTPCRRHNMVLLFFRIAIDDVAQMMHKRALAFMMCLPELIA